MLAIAAMPAVPGFTTPRDLYCAIAPPAPLYGMPYPLRRTAADWQALYAAGVRGVVCLDEPARYDPAPLDLAAVIDLEDMVHGGAPIDPARELARTEQAVRVVMDRLERGHGMVVHCVGGRGRTGTVIGSVLVRRATIPTPSSPGSTRCTAPAGAAAGRNRRGTRRWCAPRAIAAAASA